MEGSRLLPALPEAAPLEPLVFHLPAGPWAKTRPLTLRPRPCARKALGAGEREEQVRLLALPPQIPFNQVYLDQNLGLSG